MAAEIQYRGTETGVTLYATIRSKTGTQWNTAGTPNFEAVTAANWADYDIALAESSGNYFYVGTFPAITGNMVAGWYWVDIYKQAGAGPAITDVLQGTIVGYWNGTSLLPWASDATEIKTQAVTCANPVTVLASVGTAATSTAQTGDTYALANGATGFTAIDTVVDAIKAKTDSLTFTVAGDLDANVQSWAGASVATPSVAGVPEVDITHVGGTAASGVATVDANVVTVDGSSALLLVLKAMLSASIAGTVVDAASSTTDFNTSLTEATNNHYNGAFCLFTDGALLGQSRNITTYTAANGNLAFDTPWTEAPPNGSAFVILGRSE